MIRTTVLMIPLLPMLAAATSMTNTTTCNSLDGTRASDTSSTSASCLIPSGDGYGRGDAAAVARSAVSISNTASTSPLSFSLSGQAIAQHGSSFAGSDITATLQTDGQVRPGYFQILLFEGSTESIESGLIGPWWTIGTLAGGCQFHNQCVLSGTAHGSAYDGHLMPVTLGEPLDLHAFASGDGTGGVPTGSTGVSAYDLRLQFRFLELDGVTAVAAYDPVTSNASAAPEPATLWLMAAFGIGLVGVGGRKRGK